MKIKYLFLFLFSLSAVHAMDIDDDKDFLLMNWLLIDNSPCPCKKKDEPQEDTNDIPSPANDRPRPSLNQKNMKISLYMDN